LLGGPGLENEEMKPEGGVAMNESLKVGESEALGSSNARMGPEIQRLSIEGRDGFFSMPVSLGNEKPRLGFAGVWSSSIRSVTSVFERLSRFMVATSCG
jgi:hypothetical protein